MIKCQFMEVLTEMQIVIINRTDKNQQIRKANGEIVVIKAYTPYILETVFKPEINFWTGCTDDRFIVATDVNMLPKLVAQLPKKAVDVQKSLIRNSKELNKPQEVKSSDTTSEKIDVEEIKVDTKQEVANEDKALEMLDNAYKTNEDIIIDDIKNLKMNDLKILAAKRGIEVPRYCKKAELIDLIIESIPK